jgi:hypothetical protein
MLTRRSRKYNAHDATKGGGVGHATVGETHEITFVELSPICAQPKGKVLSTIISKRT